MNHPSAKTTRRELVASAGAMFAAPCFTLRQDLFDAATRIAEEFRVKYGIPGLSIAIARNERLLYARGFGFANADTHTAVKPDTLFRIASVSKPITSVTLFKLIEAGKVKLSDTVFGSGGILEAEYGKGPFSRGISEITVEHLATHTCGGWKNDGSDPMFHNPEMNHHQLIAWTLANQPLIDQPGKRFGYSNFGYCVLGRVIEKLELRSYHSAVQEHVLKPCGISQMRIAGDTQQERAQNEATYYVVPNGGDPYGMKVARMDSHGGWLASPTDLVKFLTRVDGFPERKDILKETTLKSMWTPTTADAGYAHGWMVNSANNCWHNGSLPGTSSIAVRTSGDFCWAAITNMRKPGTKMDSDLDELIWRMKKSVSIWPEEDLFRDT